MAGSDLARLLLGTPSGARSLLDGAYMTAWNPTTYANTVSVGGAVTYTNLAVLNPGSMSVGPVLLIATPGGPIVLGRLYQVT